MPVNLMPDQPRPRIGRARGLVALFAAVACAGALVPATGHATDLKPYWATAYVDDSPFLDASTRQPMPAGKAFPRGWVQDTYTDGFRVRMKVTAYDAAGRDVWTYFVDSTGAKAWYDRILDVTPTTIASITYDLCRQPGENGAPDACAAQVRLYRPAPPATPAPPPPPPPVVTPQPTPPPPPASTVTTPPSTKVPATTSVPAPTATPSPVASELTVVPTASTPVRTPPGCVPRGEPIRFRLSLKRHRGRARPVILRVVFFLKGSGKGSKKGSGKVVVDRRAPYRATLPVGPSAGARTRGYARIRFRVKGRHGAFTRTVSKSFTICR